LSCSRYVSLRKAESFVSLQREFHAAISDMRAVIAYPASGIRCGIEHRVRIVEMRENDLAVSRSQAREGAVLAADGLMAPGVALDEAA
jgi:hypothetical protein